MPHLSTTDADLAQRLNSYEIKRQLVQVELAHPPQNAAADWLTDKESEVGQLTLFIDTLKGVLKA